MEKVLFEPLVSFEKFYSRSSGMLQVFEVETKVVRSRETLFSVARVLAYDDAEARQLMRLEIHRLGQQLLNFTSVACLGKDRSFLTKGRAYKAVPKVDETRYFVRPQPVGVYK